MNSNELFRNRGVIRTLLAALFSAGMAGSSLSYAVTPASLAQAPLFLVTAATPLVMLNMSNDHQLFYKAYDDWSDVDKDDQVDTTYKHSIDYYGYFDSYKCYVYSSTNSRFEPDSVTADKYCGGSGEWSGNFLNWASMSRIDTVRKILYGGYRSTDTSSTTVLERSYLPGDAHSFAKYYNTTTAEMRKLTPWSTDKITMCNTTYASSGYSQTVTAAPLIRVANGNFALWAANERYQCHWKNKSESESNIFNSPNSGTNNGNYEPVTGLDASANNPSWTSNRLGDGDYVARVEACVSGLIGKENCRVYPSGNAKPIGLLQEYGEEGQIEFGLITGSFQKNKSGGTLRRNVGDISNEINVATNGTFKSAPAGGNIIGTLNALRVYGYEQSNGYYNSTSSSGDSCPWGLNSFIQGRCSNWGNPQTEIFLESLRYFAGQSATASFAATDTGYLSSLPTATWSDPLSNANYCAPVNVIQFNASVSSYDNDQLSGASDIAGLSSAAVETDKVGDGEGISGTPRFVGKGTGTTTTDGLCTAKTVTDLSDATGLCPEAPRLDGSYEISGLAFYAHTHSIRTDLTAIDGTTPDVLVNTYGVSLAPSTPKITVPVDATRSVTILPACRNSSIGGNCAIVDFKVVQKHTDIGGGVYTGKFYVNWEDSEQGGDYDQDMAGVISYSLSGTEITVTTSTFADSTPNAMAFGYVIAGTTKDGFHAHSGINNFTGYTDPSGVATCNGGSVYCETGQPATSVTYSIGASGGDSLKDPLWYAAKWGGFEEKSDSKDRPSGTAAPNGEPDQAYEWDSNGDGLPDNYFYATNPGELATSLSKVFLDISQSLASAASTAANSQRADAGTYVFQARFNSKYWSSELLKYTVNLSTGALELDKATWGVHGDAGETLETQSASSRRIITYDPTNATGIPFEWTNLQTAGLDGLLSIDPDTGTTDAKGQARLNFIRGDRSGELQQGGTFRNRERVLGDIVSSSPAYVGSPAQGYPDYLEGTTGEKYSEFIARVGTRTKMLYVGANDGMLHGFNVDTAQEQLAYIPHAVLPNLNQLTSQDYTHRYYVDGSPTVGDVYYDAQWHSVLVGGLNAGGQAIYALDVTSPSGFTEANAGNLVLWELNPSMTDFADLGYTFSRPLIIKNNDGAWVAVFGNGYASANGKAVLYMVNIKTGALISKVEADTSGNNGLSTVAPVDTNGDQIIDAIYAGDLKGNLWKFIPSTKTSSTWKVAFSGAPLFTAPADASGYAQPITSRPDVGVHPQGKVGVMVYFGTGKYFENGDNVARSDVQRFYGIWDLWDEGSSSSDKDAKSVGTPSISTGNLLRQCVTDGSYSDTCVSNAATSTGEALQSYDVRFVSNKEIPNWNWNVYDPSTNTGGYMGWYIDLPELGEMQVTRSTLRGGRIIFVTVVPSQHSCSDGGSSWLMELDAADGSRSGPPVFDLNGDGYFTLADQKTTTDASGNTVSMSPAGKRSKEGIVQPPTILIGPDGRREFKYASGSTGTVELTVENPIPFDEGRKSWIQLK